MSDTAQEVQTVSTDGERALFQLVWARMGVKEEACPIELVPAPPPVPPQESVPEPEPVDQQALLRRWVRDCVAGRQCYRSLARLRGGRMGQVLSRLAAEELAQARAFAGAAFLLYGTRCLPDLPLPPVEAGFWDGVRRRFWAEQSRACDYQGAAQGMGEGALADLCRETAAMAASHAQTLRSLVEQM